MSKEISLWQMDKQRRGRRPLYQYFFRKCQSSSSFYLSLNKQIFRILKFVYHTEIYISTQIGGGLYLIHPFNISIHPRAIIGRNCNIYKGVTIGADCRGKRKGVPVIGDCVFIGINSTITGRVTIGDDVVIAPNTYVNCDIPSHSIVIGNPCIIKHKDNATEGYIINRV